VKPAEERGQAAIELFAGAAALVTSGLIGLQLLGAGYAAVMADHAAEAAAIAILNDRPPERAAQRAVPGWPARAMAVTRRGGLVKVTLRPPSPFRFLRARLKQEGVVQVPATGSGP
jgi:hypothetical protein